MSVAKRIVAQANTSLLNGVFVFQFELPCVYSRQQLKELFAEVNRTPDIREIVYAIPDHKCRGCDADYGKCNCIFAEPGNIVNVIIH
jgi:hypothetical protein